MTDLNSSDASRPEEMALDIWRDLLRTIAREHMVGARDDHQFGARQSRHEVAADGERTDRIGIAPDQERRHLGEAWRKVASIPYEPNGRWRRSGSCRAILPPIRNVKRSCSVRITPSLTPRRY